MESQVDKLMSEEALEFVKQNRALVIDRYAPLDMCKPVKTPVSLFMAGSPGAGKTEISKRFVSEFSSMPVRIDADDIRAMCPKYTGDNAHIFQVAANKGVNILYDHSLKESLNCILDGTFAYGDAVMNIERSLKRGRIVEVWFVYQQLELAWEFTKAREALETRHVTKENFIKSFFGARANAISVKERFTTNIRLNLLLKDYNNSNEEVYLNITSSELDRATKCAYSLDELTHVLL